MPKVTSTAAKFLGIFFSNLSTIGFIEQAITNEAKNIIAIFLQQKIKTKNNMTSNKNIIFLTCTYLFKKIFKYTHFTSTIIVSIIANLLYNKYYNE